MKELCSIGTGGLGKKCKKKRENCELGLELFLYLRKGNSVGGGISPPLGQLEKRTAVGKKKNPKKGVAFREGFAVKVRRGKPWQVLC